MTGDLPIEVAGVKLPMTEALLDKYNVEGPRYTSYPTALDWSEDVGPPRQKTPAGPRTPPVRTNTSPCTSIFPSASRSAGSAAAS
jgi:hypothetical protein